MWDPSMEQTAAGLSTTHGIDGDVCASQMEIRILRNLAKKVANLSSRPIEQEKTELWTRHNDLEKTRSLIFCDAENGWNEIPFLNFCIILFLFCAGLLVVLSMFNVNPVAKHHEIAELTITKGSFQSSGGSSLSRNVNIIISVMVVLIVISLWVCFSGFSYENKYKITTC